MTTMMRCQSDFSRGWLGVAQSFSHGCLVGASRPFTEFQHHVRLTLSVTMPWRRKGGRGAKQGYEFSQGDAQLALTEFQHNVSQHTFCVRRGRPKNPAKDGLKTHWNRDLIWISRRMKKLLFDKPKEQQA